MGSASVTLVMPRTPIFGLEEVEPFPVPKRPAMMQQTPSVKIPLKQANKNHQTPVWAVCQVRLYYFPAHLLIAWIGGGVAPDNRAQA